MRLVGKIKMHDKLDSLGVDEMVVSKIASVVSSLTIPAGGSGFYDVYVICSGSGGTGSGGFLEMPPLSERLWQAHRLMFTAFSICPMPLSARTRRVRTA